MKSMNHSWGTIQRLASDRQGWRSFAAALYATWRRTVEAELKSMKHSWGTIHRLAMDRQGWRSFVAALYASKRDG